MTASSTYANRIAAAVSAIALSLVLIAGTVSVPQTASASAYVSAVA